MNYLLLILLTVWTSQALATRPTSSQYVRGCAIACFAPETGEFSEATKVSLDQLADYLLRLRHLAVYIYTDPDGPRDSAQPSDQFERQYLFQDANPLTNVQAFLRHRGVGDKSHKGHVSFSHIIGRTSGDRFCAWPGAASKDVRIWFSGVCTGELCRKRFLRVDCDDAWLSGVDSVQGLTEYDDARPKN